MSLPLTSRRARRQDWLQQAIVSGFIATCAAAIALVIAYSIALALGQSGHSGNVVAQWLYGLTHNRITTRATDSLYAALLLHVAVGVLWAIVYGYDAEPRLSGPAWRRGLLFSLGPWLLSIIVLLPILGGGLFGSNLNAGPLPVIGNLILHAIYGIVLGVMYNLTSPERVDANGRPLATNNASERGAALGIGVGAVIGGIVGLILGVVIHTAGTGFTILTGPWELFLFGAILGAVAGLLLGSMSGLTSVEKPRR